MLEAVAMIAAAHMLDYYVAAVVVMAMVMMIVTLESFVAVMVMTCYLLFEEMIERYSVVPPPMPHEHCDEHLRRPWPPRHSENSFLQTLYRVFESNQQQHSMKHLFAVVVEEEVVVGEERKAAPWSSLKEPFILVALSSCACRCAWIRRDTAKDERFVGNDVDT